MLTLKSHLKLKLPDNETEASWSISLEDTLWRAVRINSSRAERISFAMTTMVSGDAIYNTNIRRQYMHLA